MLVVKKDHSTQPLDKHSIQLKTKSNAAAYIPIAGMFAKTKTRTRVEGCCSKVRIKSTDKVQFIVNAGGNAVDPISIITVFQFDVVRGKYRQSELTSFSVLGGGSTNNAKYIHFTAKKFGKSSYIVTLEKQPKGEFGITVGGSTNLSTMIVSTFAFD